MTTAELIQGLLRDALARAASELGWPASDATLEVEHPADPAHGDYATSVALKLARPLRKPPLEIATAIRDRVAPHEAVSAVTVAKPGFVNVALNDAWVAAQVEVIARAGTDFGRTKALAGSRIQVEFVSANPTGPVTVANARGGPLGDVIASLLAFHGADVQREYYVEDTGTQVDRFGMSIAVRYRQLFGEEIELPPDGYPSDYIKDIARLLGDRDGDAHLRLPLDEQAKLFVPFGIEWVVGEAKRVTVKLGIAFDVWFMQHTLLTSGYFDETMTKLREKGYLVERDGAVWFDSPDVPRDKARDGEDKEEGWVVVRSNGDPTYLGKDIAYHRLCLEQRGLDRKINVWGANTQYHLLQMKIALPALGIPDDRWRVVLYQYVRFVHEGVLQRMGKRTGQFLLLEDVLDAVGKDATRFFLLQSSADRQLDFDFELALQQSNENPVYYVQYAHARIASIFRTASEKDLSSADADVSLLTDAAELQLVRHCLRFPELVAELRETLGVHALTTYAMELAGLFHGFYKGNRVVGDDAARSKARLRLVEAVQLTLRQVLTLLGVSAPDQM
ncbi:MAG: arginine--tRNA ligase [Chloroflexi bacterium]|nr:arginine--tRNA ligase [Chloroflexota bacterium]